MALTAFEWLESPPIPPFLWHANAPALINAGNSIDADGEKMAIIGRVLYAGADATKNITKVGFTNGTRLGTTASIRVSLQDVSLTASPYQPDETADQSVTHAITDFTSSGAGSWFMSNALSATRSVAKGDLLAVVLEFNPFDTAARLDFAQWSSPTNFVHELNGGTSLKTAGAWAVATNDFASLILEFDDGTFGTLTGCFPVSATSNDAFNNTSGSGSTQKEVALEFTVPVPARICGAWAMMQVASGANFDVVLYSGTTAERTVSIDSDALRANASPGIIRAMFSDYDLATGTTYRLAIKPTTANNVTLYNFSVSVAGHFQAHPGGEDWIYNTRENSGAWGTADTVKRPFIGLTFSAADSGGGGGGGGPLVGGRLAI